jgi:ferritin
VVLTLPKRPQSESIHTESKDAQQRPPAPEGLLVVYKCKETDADPLQFLIEVGTNYHVYRTLVDWSQVRLPDDKRNMISDFLLRDGREHPDIAVRFEHSVDGLELVIQQKLSSGLQKYIYRATLGSVQEKSRILEFSHTLGVAVNASLQQIELLKKDVDDRQQKLGFWKATATRLSIEVWQKEKDHLVHNFVRLWNEKQRREKKQFQELMEELERTKKELELRTGDRKRGRHLKLDEDVANGAEDDLGGGHEPIPLDEVEALAAGRKMPAKKTLRILKADDTISAAALVEQEKAYEKRKLSKKKAKANAALVNSASSGDGDFDCDDGGGKPNSKAIEKAAANESEIGKVHPKDTRNPRISKLASLSSSESDTDDASNLKSPPTKRARPVDEATKKKSLASIRRIDESSVEKENSDDERLRAQIRAHTRKMKYTLSSSDED